MIKSCLSSLPLMLIALVSCKAQAPQPAGAAEDIAGSYEISAATNPNGGTGYTGFVQVGKRGDQYVVDWTVANSPPYKGVGLVEGKLLGVGWGTGQNYGVVVYKVDGGTLTGKWTTFSSQGKVGTETLSGPAGLNGEYKIAASTKPGSQQGYTGTVKIVPQGTAYNVTWSLPNESYSGVGILRDNVLVVGWGTGGGSAGVVAYGISNGKLDGTWAQPGGSALGTEVLARSDAKAK